MPLCDGANFQRQFCGGSQGIAPRRHGRRAGVRLLAVKCDGMPLHAFGAEHCAQRKAHSLQHRTLLNVQLKIGCRVLPLPSGVADGINGDATFRQRIFKPLASRIRASTILVDGLRAGKGRRSEKAAPKARTLLIRPIDQPHGHWRFAFVLLGNAAQDGVACDHAQTAVEPSSIGHRIEMTAENQRRVGVPSECTPTIAGGVIVMLHG